MSYSKPNASQPNPGDEWIMEIFFWLFKALATVFLFR